MPRRPGVLRECRQKQGIYHNPAKYAGYEATTEHNVRAVKVFRLPCFFTGFCPVVAFVIKAFFPGFAGLGYAGVGDGVTVEIEASIVLLFYLCIFTSSL
jgi:hypothetical protein